MKALQNGVAILFLAALAALAAVAIGGVWDVFGRDVVVKSLQTLGVLAAVSVVAIVAGRFIDPEQASAADEAQPHLFFTGVRQGTLGLLIIAVSLLALIGVLAIWEVIPDRDVLMKALSSIAIIAFASFLAVSVCLEREKHPILQKRSGEFSIGSILAILGFIWLVVSVLN